MGITDTVREGPWTGSPERPVEPVLVVALCAPRPSTPPSRHGLGGLSTVTLGRGEAPVVERTQDRLRLVLADRWVSTLHATVTRAGAGWLLEDRNSKNGVRVNGEPVTRAMLADGDLVEVGRTFLVFRDSGVRQSPPDLVAQPGTVTLIPQLAERFETLPKVVALKVPVMVLGETGSGKEVAARLAHAASKRTGPFVAVNCGALPRELLEGQLFGYVKGAFTGATEDRPGLVRSAHGGTLFLDEVGELPVLAQPALLRVLQEHEVTPVGATRPIPVDIQLVTATNRSLASMVAQGTFRADLHSRLTGYTVQLPPLRERREDLGLIVGRLLAGMAPLASLTGDAARLLFLHRWPYNVRELERTLQVAAAIAPGGVIDVPHLPESVRQVEEDEGDDEDQAREVGEPPADLEERLRALLAEHRGNVSAVARAMGKARVQIHRWMRRFKLDPSSFR